MRRIMKSGTYDFALSGSAWLDLFGKRRALRSAAHGLACSGITKTVGFALRPGRYTLRLSKAAGASIRVMAVRR